MTDGRTDGGRSGGDAGAADRASLQAEVDRAPFHQFLRPVVENVDRDAGEVTIGLAVREDMTRVPGEAAVHGGVISALADITAHAAVMAKTGRTVPTVDLRIDYLRPAAGERLRAHATLLRCGRTLATADVRIVNDDGSVAAAGRATFLTAAIGGSNPNKGG